MCSFQKFKIPPPLPPALGPRSMGYEYRSMELHAYSTLHKKSCGQGVWNIKEKESIRRPALPYEYTIYMLCRRYSIWKGNNCLMYKYKCFHNRLLYALKRDKLRLNFPNKYIFVMQKYWQCKLIFIKIGFI